MNGPVRDINFGRLYGCFFAAGVLAGAIIFGLALMVMAVAGEAPRPARVR